MKILQRSAFLSLLCGLGLLAAGCQSWNDQSTTTKSTAVGAAIGAGAGAIIADDHPWTGAAIGAAAGGLGGHILGKNKEEKENR